MPKICMHYVVKGKVQGVWYRSFAQKKARQLGFTGWVKNMQNGDVEVLACGGQENFAQFEEWLRKGPMFAKVEKLEKHAEPYADYAEFEISY